MWPCSGVNELLVINDFVIELRMLILINTCFLSDYDFSLFSLILSLWISLLLLQYQPDLSLSSG